MSVLQLQSNLPLHRHLPGKFSLLCQLAIHDSCLKNVVLDKRSEFTTFQCHWEKGERNENRKCPRSNGRWLTDGGRKEKKKKKKRGTPATFGRLHHFTQSLAQRRAIVEVVGSKLAAFYNRYRSWPGHPQALTGLSP